MSKLIAEVFEEALEERIIEVLKELDKEYLNARSKSNKLLYNSEDEKAKSEALSKEYELAEKLKTCVKLSEDILGGGRKIYIYYDGKIEIKKDPFNFF